MKNLNIFTLFIFMTALLLSPNISAEPVNANVYKAGNGNAIITHTKTDDTETYTATSPIPTSTEGDKKNIIVNPIIVIPGRSECSGKSNGFYCGADPQSLVLYQCIDGAITASRNCSTGCDGKSNSCNNENVLSDAGIQ